MNVAAVTLPQPFLRRLKHIVGAGNCRTDPADCWAYGYDNSKRHALPQAVAFAAEHDQVRELAGLCHEFEVPLVARGRGTGTTGATTPIQGGWCCPWSGWTACWNFPPTTATPWRSRG